MSYLFLPLLSPCRFLDSLRFSPVIHSASSCLAPYDLILITARSIPSITPPTRAWNWSDKKLALLNKGRMLAIKTPLLPTLQLFLGIFRSAVDKYLVCLFAALLNVIWRMKGFFSYPSGILFSHWTKVCYRWEWRHSFVCIWEGSRGRICCNGRRSITGFYYGCP